MCKTKNIKSFFLFEFIKSWILLLYYLLFSSLLYSIYLFSSILFFSILHSSFLFISFLFSSLFFSSCLFCPNSSFALPRYPLLSFLTFTCVHFFSTSILPNLTTPSLKLSNTVLCYPPILSFPNFLNLK